jgi:glycosyltransferase involved in cell wall biosynthesis
MQALAVIQDQVPAWKYVCKVWPQPRTTVQTQLDMELADQLGIRDRVVFTSDIVSRNYMPYLMNACDIYAAPSRLEGFGMPQIEAGSCGKPVIGLQAMGMLDTLIHRKTALLAKVGKENRIHEVILGPESGFEVGHRVVLDPPRVADYRADVGDVAEALVELMNDPPLRERLGKAGRKRAVEVYDYRVVARLFVNIVQRTFGIQGGGVGCKGCDG